MATTPTLLHGINESSDGQLDLEDTTYLGKLIGKTLFNTFSKSFEITGPPLSGTLDNFSADFSGSAQPTFDKVYEHWLGNLTVKASADAEFSISFANKNGADNYLPLIESMEFKDNEIISISEDGKAKEKIRYTFDANVDLSSSTSHLNTLANIKTNLNARYGSIGQVLNVSPSFKVDRKNDPISFPNNHPVSFTVELELPSYNTSQINNLQESNGIKYSKYPKVTSVKIESLKTNELFKKTYGANKVIAYSEMSDQVMAQLGTLGTILDTIGLPIRDLANSIATPIVDAMDDNINHALEAQENRIAGQLNTVLASDEFIKSDAFGIFTNTYREWVTEEAWNRSDYPIDGFSLQVKDDLLTGTRADDILRGKDGNDQIIGKKGDDIILGGRGNDLISGGLGQDQLSGGAGRDIFIYNSVDHSKPNSPDTIINFGFSKEADKIDLSRIISKDLVFIDDKPFSGISGEVRFEDSILELDANGDAKSDLSVVITGSGEIKNFNLLL